MMLTLVMLFTLDYVYFQHIDLLESLGKYAKSK